MNEPLNFTEVRRAKALPLSSIAKQAEVSVSLVYLFEIGVKLDDAVQVSIVHAFSLLAGHHYHSTDFQQGDRPHKESSRSQPRTTPGRQEAGRGKEDRV